MSNKKLVNSVGLRLFIFAFIVFYIQFCGSLLITLISPEFAQQNVNNMSMILVILSVDIIGLPCFAILLKKIPKGNTEQNKISLLSFLKYLCISFTALVIGSSIGNAVQMAILKNSYSEVSALITSSDWLWRILAVSIGAPICEELIFRKLLIDRLVNVGRFFAIFVSALCFGLYHGNFIQFFFAFFLGLIWGYIYVKTGKIIYSILIHMFINTSSSVVTVFLLQHASETDTLYSKLYVAWIIFYYVLAVIGLIVLLCNIKKIRINESENALKPGMAIGRSFTSWGLWTFYIACMVMFAISMLSNLFITSQEVVSDIQISYEVNIENNNIVNNTDVDESVKIPISDAGEYVFSFDWFNNKQPGFITGISLVGPDNNKLLAVSGDLAYVTMHPIYLESGDYFVEFDFLDDEEEFIKYVSDNIGNSSDTEYSFEYFGQDGEYTMKYRIKVLKRK